MHSCPLCMAGPIPRGDRFNGSRTSSPLLYDPGCGWTWIGLAAFKGQKLAAAHIVRGSGRDIIVIAALLAYLTILSHHDRFRIARRTYELRLLSFERAVSISSPFISRSAPVFATPPVAIAPKAMGGRVSSCLGITWPQDISVRPRSDLRLTAPKGCTHEFTHQ